MTRQILLFILSLAGIIAAISLVHTPASPPPFTNMYAPPPVNPFTEAVAATGIIEAGGDNIVMGIAVEGVVQQVFVEVGDKVKSGDKLLQTDDRLQKAAVEVARQNVEVAAATVEKNLSQLERLMAVKNKQAISIEDLRNKESDVKVAKMQLESSKASLEEALIALERTTILAPKDGTILRIELRKGEFASGNALDPTDSLTPMIILGGTNTLQVRVDVDEQSAYRIRENQKAIGYTRSTALVSIPLTFSHIEPFCVPKRNLSSASNERVDTRVLQVIYTFEPPENYPVYVGQLIDVFIQAPV